MMKKLNVAFAVVMAIAFGQQAMATDGTITFNGEVTDVTCTVSAGGVGGDATVTLPTVGVNAFGGAADTTAGVKPFSISLSGCSSASGEIDTAKNVAVYFEQGGNVNANGRLTNTAVGGAQNVDIALYRASDENTPLMLGQVPTVAYSTISSSAPATTMDFLAKYYSTTASVTSGLVTTNVTYSIVYP